MKPYNPNTCVTFDIETLDIRPSAIVLSLGVVLFPINKTNKFSELLENGINLYFNKEQQIAKNRTTSPDTIQWWSNQSPASRECLNINEHMQTDCRELHPALWALYKRIDYKPNAKKTRWFSRGSFDHTILESFCHDMDIETPYKYWCWRDSRSFLDGAKAEYNKNKIDKPEGYIPHNSIHDAAYDAYMLQRALNP